jgi:malate permease and related proteins
MATLISALTTIVLPILLVAGVGFVLRRTQLIVDPRSLARLSLYFFSPALVLNSIARSRLSSSDFVSLLAYTLLMAAVMGTISYTLARLLNFDRLLTSAFLLTLMFVNAGNIGIPFNQFAFGEAGLARAAVYFVGNSILAQTLAIFIASRGRHSVGHSLAAVFKMPLAYAALIGIWMNLSHWLPPEPLSRAIDLAANAAVPLMLVILGLELARARLVDTPLPVLLATTLKLIVTPAVALIIAEAMRLRDITRAVAVLEASMPTAVMASLIAIEFDTRSEFVTSVVFLSTLGSILTLVALLLLMGYSPV